MFDTENFTIGIIILIKLHTLLRFLERARALQKNREWALAEANELGVGELGERK